jgi:hypothetical protein
VISYTQRNELGPYGIFFNIMLSETEGFRCQEEEALNTFQPVGLQAGGVKPAK